MRNVFGFSLIFLALAVIQIDPEIKSANGCAVVLPLTADVEITDEAALIIWDAENRTEHFIRKANFTTSAKDFGFLVPTLRSRNCMKAVIESSAADAADRAASRVSSAKRSELSTV